MLRPLAPAVGLIAVEALGLIPIAIHQHGLRGGPAHVSMWFAGGVLAWLIGGFVMVVSTGLGPAVSLMRAAPGASSLRWPVVVGTGVAGAMAVMTITSTLAAALAGPGIFRLAALLVGAVATLAAARSSARGVAELRLAHS